MNYAAQQWATDLFFDVIDHVDATKVLVPCGYSALYDPAYERYFAELPEIFASTTLRSIWPKSIETSNSPVSMVSTTFT